MEEIKLARREKCTKYFLRQVQPRVMILRDVGRYHAEVMWKERACRSELEGTTTAEVATCKDHSMSDDVVS